MSTPSSTKRILSRHQTDELIGRDAQLRRLREAADSGSPIAVLGQPGAGVSELLRVAYDRMFVEAGTVIPIYFQISRKDESPVDLATRFAREFLSQFLAFQNRSARLAIRGASGSEIRKGAENVLSWAASNGRIDEVSTNVHTCFSLPLRASAAGHKLFLMLDDLQFPSGKLFMSEANIKYSEAGISVAFAGHRRSIYPAIPELPQTHVESLPIQAASELVSKWAIKAQVEITEECADLAAVQLGGRPAFIGSLVHTASQHAIGLNTFSKVEQAYTQALLGGSLARRFDRLACESDTDPSPAVTFLRKLYEEGGAGIQISDMSPDELSGSQLARLHNAEMVNLHTGAVWPNKDDVVLSDYIRSRHSSHEHGLRRASIYGKAVTSFVARAPKLMASHYRRHSSLPLKEILAHFDGRAILGKDLDYAGSQAVAKDGSDPLTIKLPFITFTAETASMYPTIAQLLEPERSVIGMGFVDQNAREPVAWIAAEIDSKLEADAQITEFWCDRLEMAALHSDFSNYRIWLIAPEGFESNAAELLASRNAIGSSRRQVRELMARLSVPVEVKPNVGYEITIPSDNNSELIGAKTLEEIAQKAGFPPKAINQMKTALVEACINASEHSLSPDGKIRIRFQQQYGQFVITVSNRGLRLSDKAPPHGSTPSKRRGWGLKLIEGLMDEVSSEYTDDGTILRMAKGLPGR